MESHILQVKGAISSEEHEDQEQFSHDIFEVFATEKKKHEGKASKASELSALPPAARTSTPPPPPQLQTTNSSDSHPNLQYHYHSNAKDQQLVSKLEEYLMQGRLSLTTPAHIFATSPAIRKNIVEKLKVQHMETNEYEAISANPPQVLAAPPQATRRTTVHNDTFDDLPLKPVIIAQPSAFCLPLQEIDMLVNATLKILAILDTGSQIIIIWHNIVQSLGVPINYQ